MKKNTKVKEAKVNKKKLYLANPYGFSKQTKNFYVNSLISSMT